MLPARYDDDDIWLSLFFYCCKLSNKYGVQLSMSCINTKELANLGGFIIFVSSGDEQNGSNMLVNKKVDWVTTETLVFREAVDAGVLIAAVLQEIVRLPRLHEVLGKTDSASPVEPLKSSNRVSDQHLRDDETS